MADDLDRDRAELDVPITGDRPWQTEGLALPSPTQQGKGYPLGWRITYRRRCLTTTGQFWAESDGIVAGPCLRDVHANTTWVPLRPAAAAPGVPPRLVRVTDVLYAECPEVE